MIPAPCPFCGKKHPYGVEQESIFDRYYVWCEGCDTTGPRANTPTEAIKAWNQRVESQCESAQVSVKSVEDRHE